jgi:hypothetical protein
MTLRIGLRLAWPDSSASAVTQPENLARTEWHLHAAAHLDLSGQAGRNQVIEFLAERNFKADAGDHVLLGFKPRNTKKTRNCL